MYHKVRWSPHCGEWFTFRKIIYNLLISEFCNTCVAVDPNDAKSVKNKVVFSTGCKAVRCVADLILQSSLENIPMYFKTDHCQFFRSLIIK